MTLQQIINLAVISFVCVNATIVTATAYQVVQCPDLEGNLINYPEGTKCVNQEGEEEEEEENKDDNNN